MICARCRSYVRLASPADNLASAVQAPAPWTDETIMPWGKYRDTRLADVPPEYLLWLGQRSWINEWPGLRAWLDQRFTTMRSD
jgi:hypothetical protein